MSLIEKIEIRYLRSIYEVDINNLSDLNIFSGLNDVGKSNIIKALNLFFNGHVDWNAPFDFSDNFSTKRKILAQQNNSQFTIYVAVTFNCPPGYQKSLPPKFRVRRLWNLNGEMNQIDDLEARLKRAALKISEEKSRIQLNNFLKNRVRFEYIPAVKDQQYFQRILGILQASLINEDDNDPIVSAIKALNQNISTRIISLQREFERITNIKTEIELPLGTKSFLEEIGVIKAGDVPLTMRGDGIQASFIPELLHLITERSSRTFIWGFEEPENSLEYGLAAKIAQEFVKYSKKAQIFLTTHSPAFLSLNNPNLSLYRVYRNENDDVQVHLITGDTETLATEMRFIELAREINERYQIGKKEIDDLQEQIKAKDAVIQSLTHTTIFVEGDWDLMMLNKAWKMCYPEMVMPFVVKECGGTGGLRIQIEAAGQHRDLNQIIIGIFDQDTPGIKDLENLNVNNFHRSIKDKTHSSIRKATQNRKVAALSLPTPGGREAYENRLTMELYFPDEVLKYVNSEGVEKPLYEYFLQERDKPKRKISQDLAIQLGKQPEDRELVSEDAKRTFAREVVPNLNDPDLFKSFHILFSTIDKIIEDFGSKLGISSNA